MAFHATRMQFDPAEVDYGFEGGGPREPSEKQVRYAQRLAQQLAIPLPQDALIDFDACRSFIDDALTRTPASTKQIEFAEYIARTTGIELPPSATASSKAISEFIEANRKLLPNEPGAYSPGQGAGMSSAPPTDKQILFAARLARENQMRCTSRVRARTQTHRACEIARK